MENQNKAWIISAKSNLHVGNENTSNYGIIDKSVQRDALTNLPCINSSSLKGAVNEYFAHKKETIDGAILQQIFGSNKRDKNADTQKGEAVFFDAQLLSIPVQSDKKLFYRATCPSVIMRMLERLKLFGIQLAAESELKEVGLLSVEAGRPLIYDGGNDVQVGEYKAVMSTSKPDCIIALEQLVGTDIVLFNDTDFKMICEDENLPIIARNCLENGESKNLWYEQILPQETSFYTVILGDASQALNTQLSGQIVQIGANATIGYGYCKFKTI